jgi:hypothetical protein
MTFNEIAQEIRHLSVDERKRLITLLVDSFTEPVLDEAETVDIIKFAGIGRYLYGGSDVQDVVNEMQRE